MALIGVKIARTYGDIRAERLFDPVLSVGRVQYDDRSQRENGESAHALLLALVADASNLSGLITAAGSNPAPVPVQTKAQVQVQYRLTDRSCSARRRGRSPVSPDPESGVLRFHKANPEIIKP